MDTRELPKAKSDLERDIGSAVREKLRNFKKETGISVVGVDLIFTDTTTVTDISVQAELTEVCSTISI